MEENLEVLDIIDSLPPGSTMFDKRDAWMLQKAGKFTSSEAHKLFTKKSTPYFDKGAMTYIKTKAVEILTGKVKELNNIVSLEWGNANENEAVQLYSRVTGNTVEYYGVAQPRFFPYGDHAGGSPDGLIGTEGVLECKCPYDSEKHLSYALLADAQAFRDYCPEYFTQVQMNMMVCERTFGDFISYDPRIKKEQFRLKIIRVPRDEMFIAELKIRIERACEEVNKILTSL